ncbi:FAD-binding oxidoreductase [Aquibium sp. ELW1220]|uniref:NAD(P)/FAD-dependent oxidoreductase n=1 Tax=Aquibium sp. ELW1220 TaxID=2976766 RepID=UPI0025B0D9B8|nr:FAD-binding oxidoreductase [Aquibium sp. ELW1220]MDN2580979.1 FAD-binding oxidoreductase [Aquibium sp. ELW1220]
MADDLYDIIVIGAGMAGASVAAELAVGRRILLLEAESRPGYHTTGRSAALFTAAYGPPVIRALSRASLPFYRNPQSPFVTHPLLKDRGVLFIARSDQARGMAELVSELGDAVRPIDPEAAQAQMPLLRRGHVAQAVMDDSAADIDVDALHQHYLKSLQATGGVVRTHAGVTALGRVGGDWVVETRAGRFRAAVVVNAAGAWADEIAAMAGVARIGLVPKRRTAVLIDPPAGATPDHPAIWPAVVDVDEQFYIKPDAGKLLISPADETPSAPCDAQPEELDVAICIDRIETAFDISVRRIEHKWAGLRSFVADKAPVAGYAPDAPGFFWLAGQGGYGIQSAPALSRTAAALVLGRAVPDDVAAEGVEPWMLGAERLGGAA